MNIELFKQPLSLHESHNTAKEKLFLDGILHGEHVPKHTPEKAEKALRGYIDTVMNREFDDGVSASACLTYAQYLLTRC